MTVNGGDISGHTGIEMCAGKLVVKGGSITSSGANMDATGSQNAILDGGAISIIDRNYPGGTPTMEITGGTIRATGEGALAGRWWGDVGGVSYARGRRYLYVDFYGSGRKNKKIFFCCTFVGNRREFLGEG